MSLKSHKTVESWFIFIFLLVDGKIRIRTNNYWSGTGSWRPKNMGILRIRIWNTAANSSSSDIAITIEDLVRSKPNAKSSLLDHNSSVWKKKFCRRCWSGWQRQRRRTGGELRISLRYRPSKSVLSRGSQKDVDFLGCLTNSVLVFEFKCGKGEGLRGLSQWVQLYTMEPK